MNQKPVSLDELLRKVGNLPPLPAVAQKALALIRDENSNMADIANVLSLDQAMTSLVLRWANSAYYGLSFPISTVQQAVTYLGQNTVQSLILTVSVAAFMDRPVPGYGLERGDLWKHAVGVAGGARLVAMKYGRQIAEEAYHAGLLCDIGKLAFEVLLRNLNIPEEALRGKSFFEIEKTYFGVDHAILGAEMARRWKLPETLQEAITYHHNPGQAPANAILPVAVHLADAAVMTLGIGIGRDGLQYSLDPIALEKLGWSDTRFNDLIDRINSLLEEAEAMIGLRNRFK
jgi:putative nucleotidyltransferase with HDIG domain